MRRTFIPLMLVAAFHSPGEWTWAQQAPPAEASAPIEDLAPETNPAVRAALALPRTEPRHYLGAVLALVDLGRPELAAPILKELADLDLNDAQRAALVEEFGSGRMLQLARNTALAPAAQEFAEAAMAAAAARARDPERIARLIEQLTSASASARTAAIVDLSDAGAAGTVATIEAWAQEADPQRRAAIAAAIVRMDPAAVDPLLGMLSTNDPRLRRETLRLLREMHVTLALPLIAANSSSAPAERLLDDAIGRHKRGMRAFPTDAEGMVTLWSWDDDTKKLSTTRYPLEAAQTIWAARLARELAKLQPDDRLVQCQALVLGLEADALEGKRSPAIADLLATADGDLLNMVLHAAMKNNLRHAAVAAAETLGQRGDAGALYATTPNPAPLAEALAYPNRRVRFAALAAIMALDPQSPFPGASRVPATLGFFATGASERRAVVAMPIAGHATTLAGRLATMGIDADAASRGAMAVQLAQRSADLELVLVDVDIDGPGIRDVLYAMRSATATGQMPIGLLATGSRLDAAERIAAQHERVVAFPRPQSEAALHELIARLQAVSDRDSATPQERAAMAAQALKWLGELLARNHTFYDLRRQAPVIVAALYLPGMTEHSVKALALLGTPESQRSLVDFASHLSVPIAAREQAAAAFSESVERFGILLTEDEILSQYERYNASESADVATQRLLGRVLDTLESRRAAGLNQRGNASAEPAAVLAPAQPELLPPLD